MTDTEDQNVQQARPAPSAGVGALLKATRTRLGQDLKQVAQALRIRLLYLQAIEEGRFDELPGPTYALGFVRSYADFLGLDSEEVVRRFRQETQGVGAKKELIFPTPATEKRLPSGPLVAAALAVCVLIYGGWYAVSSSHRPAAEVVPDVPDRLAKAEEGEAAKKDEAPSEPTTAQPLQPVEDLKTAEAKPEEKTEAKAEPPKAEPAKPEPAKVEPAKVEPPKPEPAKAEPPKAEPAKVEPPKVEPLKAEPAKKAETNKIEPGKPNQIAPQAALPAAAPGQGMGGLALSGQPPAKPATPAGAAAPAAATAPAPAATTAPAPAAPADDKSPKSYGQTEGEVRVVIKATSDSWIQVRDEKGNLVATRLLKKGDSYRVPTSQGKLSLTTGDAGALSALVDGILVTPSLGPSGSVRRDVPLDPERIKAGNP